jgi:hypothetical protein
MSIRVYVGPTEERTPNHFYSVASRYMQRYANMIPSNSDGSPAAPWCITIGFAVDWTAADADATITNVFVAELDGTENTKADVIAKLRGVTLAELSAPRRTAIQARLDTLGVPYADLDGTTTLLRLFGRVLSNLLERDFNWGRGWDF